MSALIATLLVLACSGAPEEPLAKVEQAIPACPTPAYAHIFSTIAAITSMPDNDPVNCPAAYFASEPHVWSLSANAPPPQRTDLKCSCWWTGSWQCYNRQTGDGPSPEACYGGACEMYHPFACGYRAAGKPANDCSHVAYYSMYPAYTYQGSWLHTQLKLVVSEPIDGTSNNCFRNLVINDFHTVLP
jgi:hypothetical protein